MTVIAMSRKEIDRLQVLRDFDKGRIEANEAAQLLDVTRRHIFRLVRSIRLHTSNVTAKLINYGPDGALLPCRLWGLKNSRYAGLIQFPSSRLCRHHMGR